ncbi:MAG: tetratricopeptide repeat protein [Acidobacteriia bacterium]|jgi:tetratricopeptide (TPR) repeat protein|nr:tetratricopeptide repeat protein [Terriglobia bacterium]
MWWQRILLGTFTACFSLLFLAGFCNAQSQQQPATPNIPIGPRTSNIQGFVRYLDTEAAANMIKVELRRFSGELVAVDYTRNSGEFRFFEIPQGNYILVIQQEGYLPVRETVDISLGPRMGLTLYLRREDSLQAKPPGEAVSVRELSIPARALNAFRRGLELAYREQNPLGGLKQFERAIRELPSYYEAYYEKGMLHLQIGDFPQAEQALRRALELSENRYTPAWFGLAGLYCLRNQFTEAEQLARKGLETAPDSWQGQFELGRALLGQGRTEEAEVAVRSAQQAKPDYAPVYLLLANIHIRKKDYPSLLNDLDQYLKLEPKGPDSEHARNLRQRIQEALASQNRSTPPQHQP